MGVSGKVTLQADRAAAHLSHHRRADDVVAASAMAAASCRPRCGRGTGMVFDTRDGAFY